MKRRNLAALTAAATAVAVVPAAGALASTGNDGKSVLTNSGIQRNLDPGESLSLGGAASAGTPMRLQLQLPLRNEAAAAALVARGTVLTPAQFDAQFGASQAQIDKVTSWARSQGFVVTGTSRGSGQVDVTAPAAKVNKAFGLTVHTARLDGASGLAVDKNPTVPSNLGLTGVSGLNTVHRMSTMHATLNQMLAKLGGAAKPKNSTGPTGRLGTKASTTDGSTNCSTYWGQHLQPSAKKYADQSNYICGYTPQQLTSAYGAKAYQGKAPVLGILLWGNDANTLNETNGYMTSVGYPKLASYTATVATASSQMSQCDPVGAGSEQNLDVQSSHAISPNSPIKYYGAADCNDPALTTSLQAMVDAHQVSTISMSFGSTTDAGMTAADIASWNRPLLKASLTGISTFASTGDDDDNSKVSGGDGKAHVGYPASSPYITAVGGTSVGIGSSGSVVSTAAWENSYFTQASPSSTSYTNVTATIGYDGGGGGVSQTFAQPVWQKGKVSGLSSTMRVVPDVAAIANPYTGYTIRFTDSSGTTTDQSYGGTSLASPVTAALVALAKAHNGVSIGDAAPYFYKLAGTSAIKDVNYRSKMGASLQGTSKLYVIGFDDKPLSLASGAGFDNATGVGTPNGAAFFTAFK